MYSLNQEKAAFAILERVGLISFTRIPREMPWCADARAARHFSQHLSSPRCSRESLVFGTAGGSRRRC